jgi:hypothetical protein
MKNWDEFTVTPDISAKELGELLSAALTGSKDALEDLSCEVVGVDPDDKNFILFRVSGNVSNFVACHGNETGEKE